MSKIIQHGKTMLCQLPAILPLGLLTHSVVSAARFTPPAGSMGMRIAWGACFAIPWAIAVLLRAQHAGPALLREKHRVLLSALVTAVALLSALLPYAYYLTHPLLAAALAWLVLPWLRRLPWHSLAAHKVALASGFCAFAWIFTQSLRRHLWFGSGGKDLGLFHQSIWLLSQGESPQNTIMGMHAFGDHMEFIDLLVAPLMWLWPSASALLLFQSAMVSAGAYALVQLTSLRLQSATAGAIVALSFLVGYDTHAAVMFDFNPSTCAAGLLPFVAWAYHKQSWKAFAVSLILVALCKENYVLYAAGLCLALDWRARRTRFAAAALVAFFLLEIFVLFPLFRDGGFRHFQFGGTRSLGDFLLSLISAPTRALGLLWSPTKKLQGLLLPFASVAFLALLKPRYLLALAPGILERFWSDIPNRWWGHHYGIGTYVLCLVAAVEAIRALKNPGTRKIALVTVFGSALLLGLLAPFGPGSLWQWRAPYYASAEVRDEINHAITFIGEHERVAAQNHIIPHLSARRHIYELRTQHPIDVAIVTTGQDAWPYPRNTPRVRARELVQEGFGFRYCGKRVFAVSRDATRTECTSLVH